MERWASFALVFGSLVWAGCNEAPEVDQVVSTSTQACRWGRTETQPCQPYRDGAFPMMASLAATMAFELGRWNAGTDLEYREGRVRVTPATLVYCEEVRGLPGCDNVRAALAMQDAAVLERDGEILFDPAEYRKQLRRYFVAQQVADHLPQRNPFASWRGAHELIFDTTTPGACAVDYWFKVDVQSCTGPRCGVENIVTKLRFAGWPQNGYLNPQVDLTSDPPRVSIDPPLFAMVAGEPVPVVDGCLGVLTMYDPARAHVGQCCDVEGSRGTLALSFWNENTLVCEF